MSLFKSKCSKSKLLNKTKIAEHSKVFYLKFTDSSRQERHAVRISSHEHKEQSLSVINTQEHGAMVSNLIISSHKHARALLSIASTVPMSTHGAS